VLPCPFYTSKKRKGEGHVNFYQLYIENKDVRGGRVEIYEMRVNGLPTHLDFDNIDGLSGFFVEGRGWDSVFLNSPRA